MFPALTGVDVAKDYSTDLLDEFSGGLRNFTRFSTFREVSSLSYGDIVSSIKFDKDAEFFGVAGVTKKIKVTNQHWHHAHPHLTLTSSN